MEPSTTYFISVEYPTDDGAGNYFNYGNDNSSPTHTGTAYTLSTSLGTWNAASWDSIFYLYAETVGRDIHRWGRDEQGRALQSGGSGFFTDQSSGQGVFIVNYGAGTAAYFTDNTDTQWVPPTSVTITITVKDEAGDPVDAAQVGVYTPSTGTSLREELMNKDTNASGIATESYTGTVPITVEVRVRKASFGDTKYKNFSSLQTITASGLSLAVTMQIDPNNNATT